MMQTSLDIAAVVAGLRRLEDEVTALQVTLTEDRPSPEAPALVDWVDNRVMEWLGACQEALDQMQEVQRELRGEASLSRAARLLWGTQELVQGVLRGYVEEVATYERVSALLRMGTARGSEWQAWSRVLGRAIEQCGAPICDLVAALAACWRELGAERIEVAPSVSPGPGLAARVIAARTLDETRPESDLCVRDSRRRER